MPSSQSAITLRMAQAEAFKVACTRLEKGGVPPTQCEKVVARAVEPLS